MSKRDEAGRPASAELPYDPIEWQRRLDDARARRAQVLARRAAAGQGRDAEALLLTGPAAAQALSDPQGRGGRSEARPAERGRRRSEPDDRQVVRAPSPARRLIARLVSKFKG